MPRSREMGQQKQSPRAPLNLKTTSSADSNGGVLRPVRDRSPKVEEQRRSPRSPLPECKQNKRGTRVADLETRLGHAQEELRKLKEQLASAEAAKRDAVQELEETRKQIDSNENGSNTEIKPLPVCEHTTVEEETAAIVETKKDGGGSEEAAIEDGPVSVDLPIISETIESNPQETISEIEVDQETENLLLKKQIKEVESKREEISVTLASKEEELEQSRAEASELREQVGCLTKARDELEAEMKRLKVQLEQWRKAADAAAAIISGEDGSGFERGRRERYRHLDAEAAGEGIPGSPDVEDGLGGTRRRSGSGGGGGGIRMLGELWKRKGMLQHK